VKINVLTIQVNKMDVKAIDMAKVHLLGLGEHRTVSNVPVLPALSHEVQQESFFD
jgi:hypothetical protein